MDPATGHSRPPRRSPGSVSPFAIVIGSLAILTASLATPPPADAAEPAEQSTAAAAASTDWFEKRIRPVLVKHCYECHSSGSDLIQGGLRVDARRPLRRGGDSGPAVVPGQPGKSLLLAALRYESLEMPPSGKLPQRVIADFEKWIAHGAADPRQPQEDPRSASAGAADAPATPGEPIDWQQARQFWAFQPIIRPAVPEVGSSNQVRDPIDAFVIDRMRGQGLAPNLPADRRTLIRRVTFDLTGLPPTPEQIERFLSDRRHGAYERLVDRLLASPAYGEHLAKSWMDLARYAEDQAHVVGNNRSLFYPNAHQYRDWLIEAFNDDMPYDRFVRLQLAADLIAPDDPRTHLALGFLGLGPKYYRRSSPEVMADEWEDRIDTVGRGLLGLTIACARCHDHKYDPIETEDYYALAGIFASTEMFNRPLSEDVETKKDGEAKAPEDAVHIVRDSEPVDLHVMIRGNPEQKGERVPRRYLKVLSDPAASEAERALGDEDSSGRRALAERIACRSNPLTARVMVNRVWQRLFGRGLVDTPSNFGQLGSPPSHPRLLDALAVQWIDSGWSLKSLQRRIVLSATYRQASSVDPAKQAIDPDNRYLWRMPRRRLTVEQWRDALLQAAGRLDRTIGGPSIDPQDVSHGRRTVYSEVSRLKLNRFLAQFDHPDPNAHSGKRAETTTPLQKLFVMNSPLVVDCAERLAKVTGDAEEPAARIDRLYRRVLGRSPSAAEQELAAGYVQSVGTDGWRRFAAVLLGTNEAWFLD